MKGNKKTLAALGILVAAAVVLAGLWYMARPQTVSGDKAVTIEVVHGDGSSKTFDFETDLEYLGELLLQEGLAEGTSSTYGLYITTVDGETADEKLKQWWCITKAGEMVNTGADTTPIADGDQFELTMSVY